MKTDRLTQNFYVLDSIEIKRRTATLTERVEISSVSSGYPYVPTIPRRLNNGVNTENEGLTEDAQTQTRKLNNVSPTVNF